MGSYQIVSLALGAGIASLVVQGFRTRKASRKAWPKGVAGRRGRKAWSEILLIFKSREELPFAKIFFDLKRTRIGLQFSGGKD